RANSRVAAPRALAQQPLQAGAGVLRDEQLAGVGAALVNDRGRLAPDQLGAAGAEAGVAAEGQLAGPAVGGAVAPLHRLDAQGVAGAERADGYRLKKRAEV